jgi:hypothetical protein
MEHRLKSGHIIKDDHIKRVKKLLKKKTISFCGKIWRDEVEIELTNIRKYNHIWSSNNKIRYCYNLFLTQHVFCSDGRKSRSFFWVERDN